MADFSFEFGCSKCGYKIFKPMLHRFRLHVCDDYMNAHIYINDDLGHSSWIDHFLLSNDLKQAVVSVNVLDMKGINLSDHRPVGLHVNFNLVRNHIRDKVHLSKKIFKLRWDKGNLLAFYVVLHTIIKSTMLQPSSSFAIETVGYGRG